MKSKYIFILSCLFIMSCSVVIPTLIPFHDIPKPTGSFAVGTRVFNWEDREREEWFTEETGDFRTIIVQVWYPADTVFGNPEPYLDYAQQRVGPISEQIELPRFLIKHIQDVQSNSYANSSLKNSDMLYPMVIFSHGLGGYKTQNTIAIEALVSKGYIVISADHTYDANITVFEDGSYIDYSYNILDNVPKEKFWDVRIPQVNTRAADISFMIDKLQLMKNHPIYNSIDFNNIGVFGMSTGGTTAIVSSWNDTRISACLNLDGWIVPVVDEIINTGIKIPFCFIGQEYWEGNPLNYDKLDKFYS